MKIEKYITKDMKWYTNLHPYKQVGYSIFNKKSRTIPFFYYRRYIKGGSGNGTLVSNGEKYHFLIKQNYHEEDSVIELFIGKTKKCLVGFINYDKKTKKLETELLIQSFGYYSDCSEGNEIMRRGEGTEKMLLLFIKYVRENLKGKIKKITLSDNAMFDCKIEKNKNIKIPMATLYFFKYGKLYYPKFGFRPSSNDNKSKHIKQLLLLYNEKDKITYRFIENYVKYIENMNMRKYIRESEEEIQNIVDLLSEKKTIKEFMQEYQFKSCKIFRDFLEYLCLYLISISGNNQDENINIYYFTNLTYKMKM